LSLAIVFPNADHMTLVSLEARTVVDFDRVFAQMSTDPPDAVLVTSDPTQQAHMPAIIDFLLMNRIPGLFQVREHVVAGGLMSYGVSLSDLFQMGSFYTAALRFNSLTGRWGPEFYLCPATLGSGSGSRLRRDA
jgi:hypothetical protein